jgi:hypothetical protein
LNRIVNLKIILLSYRVVSVSLKCNSTFQGDFKGSCWFWDLQLDENGVHL